MQNGLIDNSQDAVDMGKVNAMKTEIKMQIAKTMLINDRDANIKQIIERLEKQEIIMDSNMETGQVKTQPDGYVYEIKQNEEKNWEVTYIGNGELTIPDAVITLSVNTTSITNEVTITMKATAQSGIASYTLPGGSAQTVENSATEITKSYVATANGTYTFTVVNGEGKTVTKTIEIDNILEAVIQLSADITTPTQGNVIVTVKWPQGSSQAIKQVKVGNGEWKTVTGSITKVTVEENAIVTARVKNTETDIIENSLEIGNIDKTKTQIIVEEGIATIDYGTSKDISSYFTVVANGIDKVTDVMYVDTSNGDAEVENTNTLEIGTHVIKCIAIQESGTTTTATKTIVVEPGVYGNLYKISDTEYHLIFNGTGAIAEGYTEGQLVAKGTNIRDGSGLVELATDTYMSNQPWGPYSANITKVKIEEAIKPSKTDHYFRELSQISEIEGIENIDISNLTSAEGMFARCSSLTNLDVSKWDTSNITNMHNMFERCSSLINLDVSKWNTSNVTNIAGIFSGCNNLANIDVSKWDTSSITQMQYMFNECKNLTNIDVSEWDTGNVTNMLIMFFGCTNLANLDVSKWNTSNVTNMRDMFYNCKALTNLDVSNWDTSNVTNMHAMFGLCNNLTSLDVSNWDTSNVTIMKTIFYGCEALTNLDVSKWNTSNVTNMDGMFGACKKLTSIDVSNFDTSNVTDMNRMFYDCTVLTSLDLSSFDTSKVTNMQIMFYGCKNLTTIYAGDNWSTEAVTESTEMFYGSTKLRGAIFYDSTKIDAAYANSTTGYFINKANIGVYGNLYKISDTEYHLIFNSTGAIVEGYTNEQLVERGTNIVDGINEPGVEISEGVYISTQPWGPYSANITKVKIVEEIKPRSTLRYFLGLSQITEIEGLENLDMSSVTTMKLMFRGCSSLTSLDVSNWNTENVTDMANMFEACSSLTSLNVSNWNTGNVGNMNNLFYNCSSLTNLDVSDWNTGNVTNMDGIFYGCSNLTSLDVSDWDTSSVTGMSGVFYGCSKLSSLDVSHWDTTKVTVMWGMFSYCNNLTSVDVSNFDTSNVTNMGSMFRDCNSLTSIDVGGFETMNVTSMEHMFYKCGGLTSVDVSKWDTSKVMNMWSMFSYCNNLTNVDVSGFNTSNVTNMEAMFRSCSKLVNLNVSGFDTTQVTTMLDMFGYCNSLISIDVSNFDTAKVTNMMGMFVECSSLTSLDLSSFNTVKVTNMQGMFGKCSNLKAIYVGDKWSTESVTESNWMFENDVVLRGAIAYDPSKIDATYANWETGYLTYVNKNDIILVPSTTASGDTLVTAIYGRNLTGAKTLTCTGAVGTDYVLNGARSVTVKTNQTVTATGVTAGGETLTVSLTVNK